jgi:hypothetical protein
MTHVQSGDPGVVPAGNHDGMIEGVLRGLREVDRTEDPTDLQHGADLLNDEVQVPC